MRPLAAVGVDSLFGRLMNVLYRLALKDKIFLLTLGMCLVVWIPIAIAMRTVFQANLSYELLVVFAAPVTIFLLLANRLADYIAKPLVSLTDLADKISQGNLNLDLDFGKKVRCWEIKGCNQPGCPAYGNEQVLCWFVNGTPCRDCVPRFPNKLVQCRHCVVYQSHKGDEIVQMADSFKHMAGELKKSRHELEQSLRLQDGVISHSFDGIIGTDVEGDILIFNAAASSLSQYAADEVMGKMSLFDFFPLEFQLALRRWLKSATGKPVCFLDEATRFKNKSEQFIPVMVTISLLQRERDPLGVVCFIKDLREVAKLKEDLRNSERMAVVGEITAALSHSMRNIVEGLRGGSYVLITGQKSERWGMVTKGWEMIERNLQRIDVFMHELLKVTENQNLNISSCNVIPLLQDTLSLVRDRAERASIEIQTSWEESPLPAEIDPEAIRHCFFNILSNAVDACDSTPGRHGIIRVAAEDIGGEWIAVTVQDNGVGMDEVTKNRVFKEIFTTKGSSGLGLGMFVTGRLLHRHGGVVDVESRPGFGSKVTVNLPTRSPRLFGLEASPS